MSRPFLYESVFMNGGGKPNEASVGSFIWLLPTYIKLPGDRHLIDCQHLSITVLHAFLSFEMMCTRYRWTVGLLLCAQWYIFMPNSFLQCPTNETGHHGCLLSIPSLMRIVSVLIKIIVESGGWAVRELELEGCWFDSGHAKWRSVLGQGISPYLPRGNVPVLTVSRSG